MKILHIAPSIEQSYGGPTQSLAGYALAARSAGMEVTVAAPRCPLNDESFFADSSKVDRLKLFNSIGSDAFVFSPALTRWVARNADGYDLVHVHGLLNSVSSLSARAALKSGVPVVIRPFGTLSRYTFTHRRGVLKHQYFRRIDGPNLERAAAIHFTTITERDEAAWHGIRFDNRAHVVPPPYVADQPQKGARSAPAERVPHLVLFLSRLHPVKRIEILLDAWPAIRKAMPDAQLVIAGTGKESYERALRARARQLSLGESVTFTGFVSGSDKRSLFAKASVFVLPSQHENFGVVVLEALAAGIPVVVSPEVQLAEFVTRNHLGLAVDARPTALGTAIVQILSSSELQGQVQTEGPAKVNEEFSVRVISRELTAMYAAAANEADSRALPIEPRVDSLRS